MSYALTTPDTPIDHSSFHRRCILEGDAAYRLAHEIPMMNTWIHAWYYPPRTTMPPAAIAAIVLVSAVLLVAIAVAIVYGVRSQQTGKTPVIG